MHRAFAALLACLALVLAPGAGAQQEERVHRDAVDRLLATLRTGLMVEHFMVPTQLRVAAVEDWGFEPMALGLDEMLGMERHVDLGALREAVAAIHRKHLSAAQAAQAADFFQTPPFRRVIAASLAGLIPDSDPLMRENLPEPTPEDEQALVAFGRTAVGTHLKAVNPRISEETQRAVEAAADAAIARFVAEQRLPHTRRPRRS